MKLLQPDYILLISTKLLKKMQTKSVSYGKS